MVRKLVLAVAAASALMSSNMALALGVGNINLRSALNQPLDAEIELLQVRDLSSNEILPSLASPDDFGRAGIDRAFFLTDLKFTPEVRPDGRAIIRVTSTQPVREPFLNFLLDVRWPSGRVLREFTVLLDPPLYQPGPVTSTVSAPTTSAPAPVTRPAPAAAPVAPPARAPSQAAAPAPRPVQQPAPAAGGQLRTNPADTLWEIAQRSRPQGASVHQTMLAIQDLNPDAFINGNINQMRANQNLTLPDASQTGRRSQSEAVNQVAEQNAAWRNGRQVAAAPAPSQRQLDARERQTAAPAPATAPAGDALRLVAGSDETGGAGDRGGNNRERQLQDALDRTKEQLDSAVSENAELSDRLQDVQGQLETLQRLLSLKDTQLAALQEQLGADADQPAVVAPTPDAGQSAQTDDLAALDAAQLAAAEEQAGRGTASEIAQRDTAESSEAPEAQAEPLPQVEPQPEPVAAPVTGSNDDPAPPVAAAPVAAEQADEEGGIEQLLQGFLQNQTLVLAVGGAALLILLLLLMALARRNARREEEYSTSFLAGTAPRPSQGNEGEFNLALASFEEPADEPLVQDVLTEADALIAYGKLPEAAAVLSDAINDEPERADYRLKLMEVKALQQDQHGYVEQAERLQYMGGSDAEIAALNARFPAMAAGLLGASVINDMDEGFDIDFDLEAKDEVASSVAAEPAMDYDFSEFQSGIDEDARTDESIESEAKSVQPAVEDEALQTSEAEAEFDLDFDLDDDLADELAQPEDQAETSILGDADFDLSLDDLETEPANAPGDDVFATAAAPESDLGTPQERVSELSLDEDFDLSLTEDLQADQLLADLEAGDELVKAAPVEPASEESLDLADVGLEPAVEAEELPDFSDEDLADFEAQLSADMASESEVEPQPVAVTDLPDALDPFAEDRPTSEAIADSMDEEFDFLSGTDECATKLDLARAYIDMGDEEGARDILSEVVEEGNDQQQKDARDMLAQLS